MLTAALLIPLIVTQPAPSTGESPAAGERIRLTVGELFVPPGSSRADGSIDLLVHLHGSAALKEQLRQTGSRQALVTVSLNGLSSVYTRQFADPEVFQTLLAEAAQRAARQSGGDSLKFRTVTVSSFSAGFRGVRELLKSPVCFQRIDALVMADSIYAGYTGDPHERKVDPELMAGFLRFAREAAAGRKQMVISHCELRPDGYASTVETADYLLRELNLNRQTVDEWWADRWRCTTRCEHAGLHVFGFVGTDGPDHMLHLRHIGRLWNFVIR